MRKMLKKFVDKVRDRLERVKTERNYNNAVIDSFLGAIREAGNITPPRRGLLLMAYWAQYMICFYIELKHWFLLWARKLIRKKLIIDSHWFSLMDFVHYFVLAFKVEFLNFLHRIFSNETESSKKQQPVRSLMQLVFKIKKKATGGRNLLEEFAKIHFKSLDRFQEMVLCLFDRH